MRLPGRHAPPHRLCTELGIEECRRRLRDSGWAGEEKPHRWQPTAGDLDVFRKFKRGDTFLLNVRATTRNHPPYYQRRSGRGIPNTLRQGYTPLSFRGRLRQRGTGTLITGRYGFGIVTIPVLLFALMYSFARGGRAVTRGDGPTGAGEWAFVAFMVAIIPFYLFVVQPWIERRLEAKRGAYLSAFLERFLEARPLPEQTPVNGRQASVGGDPGEGGARA